MKERRQYTDEEKAEHRAFAEKHWPWALAVARRNPVPGLDLDERRSVAGLALMKAARCYDPSKGYKPTTYIAKSIRQELIRESLQNRLIRAPAWIAERKDRRNPESSDYAPEYAAAYERTAWVLSLDYEYASKSGRPFRLAHVIAVREEGLRDERPQDDPDPRLLLAAIGRLPKRLARVVRGTLAGRTFRQVGAEIGCSKERARQLHGQAVAILRKDLIRSKT